MTCILTACIAAVGLHIGSAHIDPEPWLERRGINNVNPGIMVEFDNGLTIGGYKNTLGGQSLYAGYTWHLVQDWRVHPVVQAGVVTYEGKPYAAALFGLQGNISGRWGARLVYVPKVSATGAHVLHLIAVRTF